MANSKVSVFKTNGQLFGYFLEPQVISYQQGEYEIRGKFFLPDDQPAKKLEFNPQVLPYQADLSELPNAQHKKIQLVYVQRGRQPVIMTGTANGPAKVY
jgi:hypothetical protein